MSSSSIQDFTPESLVLVTGANGHVAQHVVSQLLSRPASLRPRVRATVRSERSADTIAKTFHEHFVSGALQIARVQDMTMPGAFDEALQGCSHVAHVASPLVVNPADVVEDLLTPAIQGTLGLLKSAVGCSSLKSVVVTSSFAAVFDPTNGLQPEKTYTEEDWAPYEYDELASGNLDLTRYPPRYRDFITYSASKKLAEKAAWDFYAETQPAWALAVVNPTYIGGPYILPLDKGPDSLSLSTGLMWSVASSKPTDKLPPLDFPGWVDVRDVAKAHIRALITPDAKGKRFILAPYQVRYTVFADVIRKHFPTLTPSTEIQTEEHFRINAEQAEKVLGMKPWVSFDDMVVGTVSQVLEWQKSAA